jgi:hypothetical protein
MITDIADPSVDPVELLEKFVYWINNAPFRDIKHPVDKWNRRVDTFIMPNVYDWLFDVECGGLMNDALVLVQMWVECGLVHKREDETSGWYVFVVAKSIIDGSEMLDKTLLT